jgi:hypothetical protein
MRGSWALNAQLQDISMVWTRVGVRAGEIRINHAGLGPRPTKCDRRAYPLPDLGRGQPFAAVSLAAISTASANRAEYQLLTNRGLARPITPHTHSQIGVEGGLEHLLFRFWAVAANVE